MKVSGAFLYAQKGKNGNGMNTELTWWIQRLILADNLHEFYTSPVWRRMRAKVLRDNHYECERCKKKGLVTPASTVHHRKYLRQHPELALDEGNLEPICEKCHYEEHHKRSQGFVNEERW